MRVLSISNNKLKGPLPSLSGSPSSHGLKTLWAARNSLNGSLTQALLQPPGLLHVDVSANALSGSLPLAPASTAAAPLLQLDLARNNLTGGCDSLELDD